VVTTVTSTSKSQGTVVLICVDDDPMYTDTITGYSLTTKSQLLQYKAVAAPPVLTQTAPNCATTHGWSSDFSQVVGTGSVKQNGILPIVVNVSHLGYESSTVIGATNSTSAFSASSHDAIAADFDDDGNIWWADAGPNGTSPIYIYEYADGSNDLVGTLPYSGDPSNAPWEQSGQGWFEFHGGNWELVWGSPEQGYTYVTSAGKVVTGADPFGQTRQPISSEKLARLLPATNQQISNGVYTPDGSQIVFEALNPAAGSVYSLWVVPRSGGTPTEITSSYPGGFVTDGNTGGDGNDIMGFR
jgi:hypothetical protein